MAPFETSVPLIWFGLYLLLTPAFHYVWIRLAQPTKGGQCGISAATALVMAVFMGSIMASRLSTYVAWLAGVAYVVVLVALVLGGRALHRNLEVRA
jgi:phosphatidylglycerophosphate synthase